MSTRTSLTWRSHGSDELDVDQFDGSHVLQVVPVPVVEPLAEQLDRRLRAVRLPHRHVEVVHKHDLKRESSSLQRMKVSEATWFELIFGWLLYHDACHTHGLLSQRRAENALAAFVELGHDDALRLVGAGLRREVDDVRLVRFLVQFVQ